MRRSPLAPAGFPAMPPVAGVRLAAAKAGIKARGTWDLMLAELAAGTTAAGVLTRSLTASAPVAWCRGVLAGGRARALIANSGNANAFTGKAGERAVRETARAVAGSLGCPARRVLVASTGVIGERLAYARVANAVPALSARLAPTAWEPAARAIMTTDTFPKGAFRAARIGDADVVIAGIAKGAGMIAPDMGTMLAFLFTDARLPAPVLQACLADAVARSFNCITVDGDTSTSDTCLLFATGRGGRHPRIDEAADRRLDEFRACLAEVAVELAQLIVRDGEGAEKFVTVSVAGAASARAARRIGLAIANSPLVKTAIAGADPNWGRIVAAIGKAGERADRDRLVIRLGDVEAARAGAVSPAYDERRAAAHFRGREVRISVDVGVGRGRATVWTCDLTHGYVDINAHYRS